MATNMAVKVTISIYQLPKGMWFHGINVSLLLRANGINLTDLKTIMRSKHNARIMPSNGVLPNWSENIVRYRINYRILLYHSGVRLVELMNNVEARYVTRILQSSGVQLVDLIKL